MGKEADALWQARRQRRPVGRRHEVDAVIITASGCGTTIKDYGHMLRLDPVYAARRQRLSAPRRTTLSSFSPRIELPPSFASGLRVTYHSACSLQHGQKMTGPRRKRSCATRASRFSDVPEGHLCCGSAGTYNILQPEIASAAPGRKIKPTSQTTNPQVIATGNIGCITQLATGLQVPILHTVELLDWAYGGPKPDKTEISQRRG